MTSSFFTSLIKIYMLQLVHNRKVGSYDKKKNKKKKRSI